MTDDDKPSGANERRGRDRIAEHARSGHGSRTALSRLKMLERRFGAVFRITRSHDSDAGAEGDATGRPDGE